jgi:molecular chaperone DnaK
MSYLLGIDLGTTRTAAAIGRLDARPGETEIVNLGDRSSAVPSVLYIDDDGSMVVGEAAERRAVTSPDHVVREFKRRIGDPTPLIVAGRPWAPEDLSARLVRWVVDRVAQREGGPAARMAVTLPASWGTHKKERLGGALAAQGLQVSFLAEPQAAALHYASAERVEPGSTIAVYDFGGGTFDAAVVHKDGSHFTLLGRPEGVERLGGIDFDEIVFEHVLNGMPEAFEGLDESDPAVLTAVAAVRRECVEAKEALSSDTEVSIPVMTPAAQGSVRLHRSEFEAAIRPQVEETVDALRRAVSSAGLAPPQLSAVLLVGGSSRIPLVGQLVSELLGRPVTVDVDPKNAISMGAALSLLPTPPQVPTPRASASAPHPLRTAAASATPPFGGPPPGRPPVGQQHYGPPSATGAYGPGGPGGGASASMPSYRPAPQRPQAPPPRPPAAAYAPDFDDEPDYAPEFDYPERRGRTPSWLVSVGGIAAALAVIAAVFLWPRADVEPAASAPAPVTPTQEAAEPATTTTEEPAPTTEPDRPTQPVQPPPVRTTTQPPATTTTPPPATTTTPPPVTTTTTVPDEPPGGDPPGGDPSGEPDPGNGDGPGDEPAGGNLGDGFPGDEQSPAAQPPSQGSEPAQVAPLS